MQFESLGIQQNIGDKNAFAIQKFVFLQIVKQVEHGLGRGGQAEARLQFFVEVERTAADQQQRLPVDDQARDIYKAAVLQPGFGSEQKRILQRNAAHKRRFGINALDFGSQRVFEQAVEFDAADFQVAFEARHNQGFVFDGMKAADVDAGFFDFGKVFDVRVAQPQVQRFETAFGIGGDFERGIARNPKLPFAAGKENLFRTPEIELVDVEQSETAADFVKIKPPQFGSAQIV